MKASLTFNSYGGQFTLSTQLITPNYPVILSQWRSTSVSLETYPLVTFRVLRYNFIPFSLLPLEILPTILSSSSTLHWAIEIKKKKRVCNGFLFPGNLDPSTLTSWGPVVPLVCGFRRRDNLLAWRELFANLYELKSRTLGRIHRFPSHGIHLRKTPHIFLGTPTLDADI